MLHTLSQSPYKTHDLLSCNTAAKTGDDVLFYQDAVIALQQGGELEAAIEEMLQQGLGIYVLTEDCVARGIRLTNANIIKVDYAGFVKLVEKHETMYAW